jgi:membrane associated rhomboid family serine protease
MNVGLYGWQVLSGVDATSPTTADAIRWGADLSPLTFWSNHNVIYSMFFHFGLVHLMLNMWALYIFGSIAGKCSGVFILSGCIYWQDDG